MSGFWHVIIEVILDSEELRTQRSALITRAISGLRDGKPILINEDDDLQDRNQWLQDFAVEVVLRAIQVSEYSANREVKKNILKHNTIGWSMRLGGYLHWSLKAFFQLQFSSSVGIHLRIVGFFVHDGYSTPS